MCPEKVQWAVKLSFKRNLLLPQFQNLLYVFFFSFEHTAFHILCHWKVCCQWTRLNIRSGLASTHTCFLSPEKKYTCVINASTALQCQTLHIHHFTQWSLNIQHSAHLSRVLLAELEAHQDAWPFLTPVNQKDVPGYRKVIKKPMDFSTIREKLTNHQYVCYCQCCFFCFFFK